MKIKLSGHTEIYTMYAAKNEETSPHSWDHYVQNSYSMITEVANVEMEWWPNLKNAIRVAKRAFFMVFQDLIWTKKKSPTHYEILVLPPIQSTVLKKLKQDPTLIAIIPTHPKEKNEWSQTNSLGHTKLIVCFRFQPDLYKYTRPYKLLWVWQIKDYFLPT